MLDNNAYNLMMQLVEENQSLWRIKKMYKKDAEGCEECLDFWEKLEKEKESRIDDLEKLLKHHME